MPALRLTKLGKDAAILVCAIFATCSLRWGARTNVRLARGIARGFQLGWWLLLLSAALPARAAVELPVVSDQSAPVSIRAGGATHWRQGAYEVWVLRDRVRIEQANVKAEGNEAVLWIDRAEAFSGRPSKVIAYLDGGAQEGQVHVEFGRGGDPHALTGQRAHTLKDRTWLGRFHTTAGIELAAPLSPGEPTVRPAVFERGMSAWQGPANSTATPPPSASPSNPVQPAQYAREEIAPPAAMTPLPSAIQAGTRVRIDGRSGGSINSRFENDPVRGEGVLVINSGVRMTVFGVDQVGTVGVEADRVVVWAPEFNANDPNSIRAIQREGRIEIYMEGNIVFRQGDRVIYADRMYYHVQEEYGVVLNAEMLTPVPEYQGLLRLKAEILQQVNRQHFEAYNAALTSSRIGIPRYWFQTQSVSVDDVQTPLVDPFTNQPLVNAQGEQQVEHQLLATSQNNFIYLAGLPIFYWPTIATDLTEPTYYVTGLRFKNDSVFGTGVMLDFDMYQILGRERPRGTKWTLSTDYFNLRGPALGTSYQYQGNTLFGIPGPYRGFIDAYGIHDDGRDNLGLDWRDLAVPDPLRGRLLARHRQHLPGEWVLTAEAGLASDYNFLEQYFEQEWDTFKDQSTGLELKRLIENSSLAISADVRPNGFVTDTEWLPRGDHFLLGQSLLFDRLTWHEHTSVGYARLQTASPPSDPAQVAVISPLPWEADVEGLRAATRHELDLPLELGPGKVVPYVLGEAAYWGQDLSGQDLMRGYFQTGVKASLPVWKADPNISSELFNLNGLSHKITYEAEILYADSSQDLSELPLYDQLDDNATEFTRRQMAVRTFNQPVGTFVPTRFDERFFALRSNLQGSVTGPTEIADDLSLVRFGINQRWQTKRGLPGQQRIIDWIVLDIGATLFPEPDRDNFGAGFGLVDYDLRWHVGDRLTLLSDGFYDDFDQGLRQVTVGGLISRPEHGSLYLGFRSTEGPISSNILTSTLSYRLSEKWIATAGASWDFGVTGNIGQNFALTRIGESFLVKMGFNYDASRDNLGASFIIEPRFLPSSRLGRVGGVSVPPAGALGLE